MFKYPKNNNTQARNQQIHLHTINHSQLTSRRIMQHSQYINPPDHVNNSDRPRHQRHRKSSKRLARIHTYWIAFPSDTIDKSLVLLDVATPWLMTAYLLVAEEVDDDEVDEEETAFFSGIQNVNKRGDRCK